jgi:hypothetical protein
MKVFTYTEASKNLAKLLDLAQFETVAVRQKDGALIRLRAEKAASASPFDVPGIHTRASTQDILDAVRDSRAERGQ